MSRYNSHHSASAHSPTHIWRVRWFELILAAVILYEWGLLVCLPAELCSSLQNFEEPLDNFLRKSN